METIKYYIRPWIHGCLINDSLILLDLKRDQYYLIEGEKINIFKKYVCTDMVNVVVSEEKRCIHSPERREINNWIDFDIITDDEKEGKPLTFCWVEGPVSPFEHIRSDKMPEIKFHHIMSVVLAGITGLFLIRFIPLLNIINILKWIKTKSNGSRCPDRGLRIARIFHELRPFMPRNRNCLYDSLCFFLFSWIYRSQPTIVFGVTDVPFRAHCWAQLEGVILNDVPQNSMQFKPIMSI